MLPAVGGHFRACDAGAGHSPGGKSVEAARSVCASKPATHLRSVARVLVSACEPSTMPSGAGSADRRNNLQTAPNCRKPWKPWGWALLLIGMRYVNCRPPLAAIPLSGSGQRPFGCNPALSAVGFLRTSGTLRLASRPHISLPKTRYGKDGIARHLSSRWFIWRAPGGLWSPCL